MPLLKKAQNTANTGKKAHDRSGFCLSFVILWLCKFGF